MIWTLNIRSSMIGLRVSDANSTTAEAVRHHRVRNLGIRCSFGHQAASIVLGPILDSLPELRSIRFSRVSDEVIADDGQAQLRYVTGDRLRGMVIPLLLLRFWTSSSGILPFFRAGFDPADLAQCLRLILRTKSSRNWSPDIHAHGITSTLYA